MIITGLLVWAILLLVLSLILLREQAHRVTPKPNTLKAEDILREHVKAWPSNTSIDAAIQEYEKQMRTLPEGWDG